MQFALLVIDGYTRSMKFHAASPIHAQEGEGQLLEALIGAAGPRLALARLEGDAAFFHPPLPVPGTADGASIATLVEDMQRAFHAKAADLAVNTLRPCNGCRQAGQLRFKFVHHAGVVELAVVGSRELAGFAVILVHRLLKNKVPIGDYLLVTVPVHGALDEAARARGARIATDVDDLGRTPTWYLALAPDDAAGPAPQRLGLLRRIARRLRLMQRSVRYVTGRLRACVGCRNLARCVSRQAAAPGALHAAFGSR